MQGNSLWRYWDRHKTHLWAVALPFFGLLAGASYFTATTSGQYWIHALMAITGYPALFLLWLSGTPRCCISYLQ